MFAAAVATVETLAKVRGGQTAETGVGRGSRCPAWCRLHFPAPVSSRPSRKKPAQRRGGRPGHDFGQCDVRNAAIGSSCWWTDGLAFGGAAPPTVSASRSSAGPRPSARAPCRGAFLFVSGIGFGFVGAMSEFKPLLLEASGGRTSTRARPPGCSAWVVRRFGWRGAVAAPSSGREGSHRLTGHTGQAAVGAKHPTMQRCRYTILALRACQSLRFFHDFLGATALFEVLQLYRAGWVFGPSQRASSSASKAARHPRPRPQHRRRRARSRRGHPMPHGQRRRDHASSLVQRAGSARRVRTPCELLSGAVHRFRPAPRIAERDVGLEGGCILRHQLQGEPTNGHHPLVRNL